MAIGDAGDDGVVLAVTQIAVKLFQAGFCRQQNFRLADIASLAQFSGAAMPVLLKGGDGVIVIQNKLIATNLTHFDHINTGCNFFIQIAILLFHTFVQNRLVSDRATGG